MADTVQVSDIGTKIILDCVEDISAATDWIIKYKKPDGTTTGEWQAIYEATTSIYYITEADDLDQAGDWCLQAYVVMPAWTGYGEKVCLTVSKNCG